MTEAVALWRPVGPKALDSIEASGMRAFPPEDLPAFNDAIVGQIEVTACFP